MGETKAIVQCTRLFPEKDLLLTKVLSLPLKEFDPEEVPLRSRRKLHRRKYYVKGPNDIWLDGNDKLKQYGFSIHGCIDGFGRKMMWLKLSPSNKNPLEIAYCYLNMMSKIDGVLKENER